MEKMDDSEGAEELVLDELQRLEDAGTEQDGDESERGRPSTPKWWRPPIPPETYKWEEVRRQRQKGGYPWTHLDKDEEIDADDYLDDNLYEPVNPPPLYGNESYLSKDLQQVPQPDERMIDIPPEIEILTSEGLDGLDKPDTHDIGFDGDREWQNASEDEGHQSRSSFTAGIRSKSGESRSATPKSVGFSPDTITHETPAEDDAEDQEVPTGDLDAEPTSSGSARGRRSRSSSPGRKQTAFDILKSKAADAADHVKQKLKSAIPVRPKLIKSRKRRKVKHDQEESAEQEVPEDAEMKDGGEAEEQEEPVAESPAPPDVGEESAEPKEGDASAEIEENLEEADGQAEPKSSKQLQKEEKERKKAEEKLAKQKAADEAKKVKLEEKLAKAREAEEKRQAKAEEEKRKQQEKEEAAKKAAEAKKEEEERKAAEKAAKEEEAKKAAEAKKLEEEVKKAAEKAKKEEEAKKRAEAKKAEEEKKAAEKAKKEEEAKLAAEAKKAEEEKKAAEKAAKEEEAKKAAEIKKAAEEEAKKAAEALKAEEEKTKAAAEEEAKKAAPPAEATITAEEPVEAAIEENTVEMTETVSQNEAQPMETTGEGEDGKEEPGEDGNEQAETSQPQTPAGTTKRKYIRHRRQIQLSQLPNPITTLRNQVEDFKNKLKRSRTPPRRQVQRKHRRSRSADASRSPPRDPDEVSTKTEEDEGQDATMVCTEEDIQQETKTDNDSAAAAAPKDTDDTELEAKTETQPETSTDNTQQSTVVKEEEVTQVSSQEPEPTSSKGTTERKRKQPAAKEKLDKLGAQLKGLGAKSIGIAAQASKEVGQKMKGVGKDLQKLGAKAVGELKSKQDASKSKAEPQEVPMEANAEEEPEPTPPDANAPARTFRFKRRNESQDEGDDELENEDQEHYYENAQEASQERNIGNDPFEGNALLGSGTRDWESPHDRANSRGVSEERFSGCRDSPPGSSLASSTIAQVRRTGVLEEIDSDEFFLRERGISEGEDEEEVNRFLVEELRQAFRPTLSNALAGFDMEPPVVHPPSRPERAPRKPPRKDKEETTTPSTYQTFPPERPKRKQPQGYISKFMEEHEDEDGEYMGSNEEVRGSNCDMEEELDETETMQLVKEKLIELDRELEDVEPVVETQEESLLPQEYEDDGRYEPINDGPTKPTRIKRKQQQKRPPTPPSFYYNTIAANEWLRELEEHTQSAEPAAPVRKRRESGKSSSLPPEQEDEFLSPELSIEQHLIENIPTYVEPTHVQSDVVDTRLTTPSVPESEDNVDYVDEAGYAIVQKDRDLPKTIPRKKKKRTNLNGQTEGQESVDPNGTFFSLPRPSQRSNNEAPPSRPNRTYSTLRPRRPPRSKSGSRQNLDSRSPVATRREVDEPRPSTAIGIMQGRPLPPPPRPQRSPAPLNDLDQSSIELSVGLRHYANFEDIESRTLEEVLSSSPRVVEVDIACQTDPVPDDEFMVGLSEESQMEDSGKIRIASSRLEGQETQTQQESVQRAPSTTAAGDVSSTFQTPPPQPPNNTQTAHSFPSNPNPTFTFPTRLHLEQLEVDFLRVNDLCAHSIKVENLQASQLEANSISSTGPVCVSRIQTQSLNSDEVTCSRLSSQSVDMPSIPPSSFFQFSNPGLTKPGSEQELCLKAEEKEDKENESACPPDLFDSVNNLMGNVDSTNDLKSSHVAEKIVDKQLNLPDSTHTENYYSKPDRKDASVGPNIPSTMFRRQLNNLNQVSPSDATLGSTEITESTRVVTVEHPILGSSDGPQVGVGASHVEPLETEDDAKEEENVVCGSYTLPYSYNMTNPQPIPSLGRTSSLKKNQQSTDAVPKIPPRRPDAHIAFGHTSVAQGDVLSIKLSIPVERGSIGQAQNISPGARSQSRSQGASSQTSQLPESANIQADSEKKDVEKASETDSNSAATETSAPTSGQSISPSSSLPPPSDTRTDAIDSDENFLVTSFRLGRSVLRFSLRAFQAMADYLDTASSEDPTKVEQQRANMQVLLCLLLVLLVGLILATTRSGPYSSPKWEFLMPPPDL